ncbi:hypothetical protein HDK64DRAFT_250478 [Phyllosticta capitalensis]|uniref:Uncharacterized protein n=1 Tax=Phyllosticta capitalensis TaxID=121624 RepID=A0ABR1Z329_9PEZI
MAAGVLQCTVVAHARMLLACCTACFKRNKQTNRTITSRAHVSFCFDQTPNRSTSKSARKSLFSSQQPQCNMETSHLLPSLTTEVVMDSFAVTSVPVFAQSSPLREDPAPEIEPASHIQHHVATQASPFQPLSCPLAHQEAILKQESNPHALPAPSASHPMQATNPRHSRPIPC